MRVLFAILLLVVPIAVGSVSAGTFVCPTGDSGTCYPDGKFPEGCFDVGTPIACPEDNSKTTGTGIDTNSDNNTECVYPDCLIPLDDKGQNAEDDNCKYPECYISLSDGNKHYNKITRNGDGNVQFNDNTNDPCNYYGTNLCDSNGNGCDYKHFDCLSDHCVNGQAGTTGLCDGDDTPWKNSYDVKQENSGKGQENLVKLKDGTWARGAQDAPGHTIQQCYGDDTVNNPTPPQYPDCPKLHR